MRQVQRALANSTHVPSQGGRRAQMANCRTHRSGCPQDGPRRPADADMGGSQMGAPGRVPFAADVAPGSTVDVSVTMTAPATPGSYTGERSLRNAEGSAFGGSGAKGPCGSRSTWGRSVRRMKDEVRGRWQKAEGGRHPADPSTTPRGTTRGSAHTCPGGQCQGDAGSPPRSEMAESRERFCSLAPRGRCLGNEADSNEGQSSGGERAEGGRQGVVL